MWKSGTNGDDLPPPNVINTWSEIQSELPSLAAIKIPRYILNKDLKGVELHGFCDASEKGYSAVVYTTHRCNDDYWHKLDNIQIKNSYDKKDFYTPIGALRSFIISKTFKIFLKCTFK